MLFASNDLIVQEGGQGMFGQSQSQTAGRRRRRRGTRRKPMTAGRKRRRRRRM